MNWDPYAPKRRRWDPRPLVRELTAGAVGLAVYGPSWWWYVAGGLFALNVALGWRMGSLLSER